MEGYSRNGDKYQVLLGAMGNNYRVLAAAIDGYTSDKNGLKRLCDKKIYLRSISPRLVLFFILTPVFHWVMVGRFVFGKIFGGALKP